MTTLAIAVVILVVVCVVLIYYLLKTSQQFKSWKRTEEQRLCEARKAAIGRSRAVLGGKFVEQMTPYLPDLSMIQPKHALSGALLTYLYFQECHWIILKK